MLPVSVGEKERVFVPVRVMESDPKSAKVTASIQEIAYYNMFLTEACSRARKFWNEWKN